MNQRQSLFAIVVIILVIFGLLAVWQFNGSSDDATPQETVAVADVTDDIADDGESSEDVSETEEAETEPVDAVETEAVDTTETEIIELNADGEYSLAPVSAEIFTSDDPLLEEATLGAGEQQILVTASFYSERTPVTVNVGDVTLIDDEGDFYSAIENGETLAPYAIGAELTVGTSLRGFVVFTVPVDAQPAMLEWCPAGNCDAVVASEVNVNE
ncbi:MAG: hypothetical protein AAFQ52_09965 [Chloroflexota bacterium]